MTVVDDIKGRVDILDLVSQQVPLQRSGRSYKANCPFHSEKTPSFFVFPERQTWRCFGACATGGDVFSFIMRSENLEFPEALKHLAREAGINLPSHRSRGENPTLLTLSGLAQEFFCSYLNSPKGVPASQYLKKRGLTDDIIKEFGLGLSPTGQESLINFLTSNEYAPDQIVLAGLATRDDSGQCRDHFRGRIMFPIYGREGKLAGFGARALDDSNPKYINTPRTALFDKGKILYGLDKSLGSIREQNRVVVVEGYMDVMMAHQNGFSNVVASMGTSLTADQTSLLSSIAPEVILALDADPAGQQATRRNLESSWHVFQRRSVARVRGTSFYERPKTPVIKIAELPTGKDPDQVLKETPNEWGPIIDSSTPLIDYLFDTASTGLDLNSPSDKTRVAEFLLPLITAMANPLEQDHYFQRLASLLKVTETTLRASLDQLGKRPQTRQRTQSASPTPFQRLEHDPLEEYCLSQLLDMYPQREHWLGQLRPEHFRNPESREVFTNMSRCSTLDVLKGTLDEELGQYLDYLVNKSQPLFDSKQKDMALESCVKRLEERCLRELKVEEELRLSEATQEEVLKEQEQILLLNRKLKELFL